MGVSELWNIITPSCETVQIQKLQGKTIAIDLSGWIVSSQKLHNATKAQPNMHLRNIFYRTTKLLMQGTIPVFVLEGKVPELKQAVMNERNNVRQGKDKKTETAGAKKASRSRFNALLRDCKKLLKLMGVSCIEAHGEAEAMCAHLEEDGLVDGCITEDGDCFLYGAKTIYRKFNMTQGTLEKYSLEKVEDLYKLGRNKMIALALICGCDYNTGVPGVGKKTALNFFKTVNDEEILEKMKSWRESYGRASKEEGAVKSHCLMVSDFPNQEVMNEFLVRKGKVPTKIEGWLQPNGPELMEFLQKSLCTGIKDMLPKVVELVARWQVVNFKQIDRLPTETILIPKDIKKMKNIMSIASYVISWELANKINYLQLCDDEEDELIFESELLTEEPQSIIKECYPELVEKFELSKIKKKEPTKRAKKNANIPENADSLPVRRARKLPSKKNKEEGQQRIDEIYKMKKSTSDNISSKECNKIDLAGKKENANISKKSKLSSKLDSTVGEIFGTFTLEDFDSDVDADIPDMSMIVQRICSREEKSSCMPTLPYHEKPSEESSTVHEISFDEFLPYVPISERIM